MIFMRSATEALNLVAYAWGLDNLGPGDVVVVTELEHHSNFVPWQYIAQRTGASFRDIPIDDSGELQLDVARRASPRAATSRSSRATSSRTRSAPINPVEQLAAWAHEQGAIMVVDAAQAAPHRPIDVQALGCDFLAFSSHKLCGPSGSAPSGAARELLEAMSPFNLGGEMIRSVAFEQTTWTSCPTSSRPGRRRSPRPSASPPRSTTSARSGSRRSSGTSTSSPRTRSSGSAESTGVDVYGPPAERRAGIVSFNVEGVHPHDVAQILDWDGVAVRAGHHCTQPLMSRLGVAATTRASFYLYTSPTRSTASSTACTRSGRSLAMSEFDQLYREVILDHYKNPRSHGLLEDADAVAEGQNPLCGDEVTVSVRFGERRDDRGCRLRGPRLRDQPGGDLDADGDGPGPHGDRGRGDAEGRAARGDRDPADARPAQVRAARARRAQGGAARAKGTPLPEEWAGVATSSGSC